MFAKAGLGLIGLSAISVGGVALAKPHLLGMDYMPEWHSLSEDNDFATAHSDSSKFGKKYGKYLVGVSDKGSGQNKKTNESWWDWAYRRLSKDKDNSKSKKFKQGEHVTGGFIATGSDSNKSLRKVCEEVYKKNDSDIKGSDGSDTDFKKDEVWKYCSPGKLTTTSEGANTDSYVGTQIGGEEANKKVLISVKNSDNDWFWKIRNEEFWSTNANENNLSGSTATANTSFKTTYDADKNKASTERKTIKQLCEDAYKLTKSENGNTNEDTDAKKFCKLEA